jgi:glycosyltransferase involved in cell wall biosynthesis
MKQHKLDKKITIIGLIHDSGGREIEVRNLIVALSEKYTVSVVSLLFMANESVAIKGLNCSSTNIFKELYNSNLILKCLSYFSKVYHNSKLPAYFLIENNLSNKLFNIFNKKVSLLKKEIDQSDAILYCGILDLNILNNILIYCDKVNKPIVLRTTGEICKVNNSLENLLPVASSILVHSKNNTELLNTITPKNINIIDQTTLVENKLLKIPIDIKKGLVFGYLGRFSNEKGIIELLNILKNNNLKIIVAGSGILENEVLDLINDKNDFLNELCPENIDVFFNKIDILIIPSFEEAGPLVGIEAMAAGKLIFSTKVGAMMERLSKTKNDFWFDINNEESFLQILEKLRNLKPEEIKAIREINRKIYLENYSIEKISNKYLKLFDTLIE